MWGILGATLIGLLGGWIGGRSHLKANQLKGADKFLGAPTGTVSNVINSDVQQLINLGAQAAVNKITAGNPVSVGSPPPAAKN